MTITPTTTVDGPAVVRVVLRRWWIVVVAVVLGASAGYVLQSRQAEVYAAQQDLYFTGQVANPLIDVNSQSTLDPARLVESQSAILSSEAVKQQARAALPGVDLPDLDVSTSSTDNLARVSVTASSQAEANRDLTAYLSAYRAVLVRQSQDVYGPAIATLRSQVDQYTTQIAAIEASASADTPSGQARLTSLYTAQGDSQSLLASTVAASKTGPVEYRTIGAVVSVPSGTPSNARTALLGGFVGAALGVLLAVAMGFRTRRRTDTEPSVPQRRVASDSTPTTHSYTEAMPLDHDPAAHHDEVVLDNHVGSGTRTRAVYSRPTSSSQSKYEPRRSRGAAGKRAVDHEAGTGRP